MQARSEKNASDLQHAADQVALLEAKAAVATARDAEQTAFQNAAQEATKRRAVQQQLAVLQQILQQVCFAVSLHFVF